AVLSDYPEVMKFLVEMRADASVPRCDGSLPLHSAAALGDPDLAENVYWHDREAMHARDMRGETPVDIAKRMGFKEVEARLEKADAGQTSQLERAAVCTRDLIAVPEGDVFRLARLGRFQQVRQLVEDDPEGLRLQSATDQRCGERLLHAAVIGGSLELVRYLTDENDPRRAMGMVSRAGSTALKERFLWPLAAISWKAAPAVDRLDGGSLRDLIAELLTLGLARLEKVEATARRGEEADKDDSVASGRRTEPEAYAGPDDRDHFALSMSDALSPRLLVVELFGF
ncbi:unnamed protein product, partial [Prorocentrum cordatum]